MGDEMRGDAAKPDRATEEMSSEIPPALRDKPWAGAVPPERVLQCKGMIGPAERACYYWLARNWFTGAGAIVDAGAFVGASTTAFAAGAAESVNARTLSKPYIHAYDFFKVVDDYVRTAITRDFGPIQKGDSYLDIFRAQVGVYSDAIQDHAGDFLGQAWDGSPIEILFIDIAKTATLNTHLIRQFFPFLIPGNSVVIHQDYYHCWHPYIHYSMEFFRDEFLLIDDYVPYQSRVWLLKKKIPEWKLEKFTGPGLTGEQRLELLDAVRSRSSGQIGHMLEVVAAWELCQQRRPGAALDRLESLGSNEILATKPDLWARQAIQVRNHILERKFSK